MIPAPLRIHKTMITVFLKDCNQISQSLYDSVLNGIQLHQLACSCGHAACFSVHGYYFRNVKLPSGILRLRVCRVRCAFCGKTHAILLSSLVPYSQIALADQQMICAAFESGEQPSAVCDLNPSIDENNVKSVIRSYRRFWREKLRSLKIALSPLTDLVTSCFADYSSQFMQIRRMDNILFPYTT